MKFFTVYEILNSILFAAVSGIIFGGIYSASESVFAFLKEMLFVFWKGIKLLPYLSWKTLRNSIKSRKEIKLSSVERNIFEAFLFSFFGIAMILISYIALDGYIRLYIFVLTVIFFFLSKKYIGKMFSLVFDEIFGVIYFITLLLISLFFFPAYKLVLMLTPLIKRIFSPVAKAVRKRRFERLLKKKIKGINNLMRLKI